MKIFNISQFGKTYLVLVNSVQDSIFTHELVRVKHLLKCPTPGIEQCKYSKNTLA